MTQKYLKLEFRFQVSSIFSRQDRKTISFICLLGEVTAWQFCFEIYWPLEGPLSQTKLTIQDVNKQILIVKNKLFTIKNITILLLPTLTTMLTFTRACHVRMHCWYIEPRNREKSVRLIWQRFSCLLDEWIARISKKKFFSRWLFEDAEVAEVNRPRNSKRRKFDYEKW